VSKEVFEAARAKAAANKVDATRNTHSEYLLQGRMVCATCGLAFGVQDRGRYQCLGQKIAYSKDGRSRTCHGAFSAAEIDTAVWEAIRDMIKSPDVLINGLKQRQAEKEAELEPTRLHLKHLKSELADVDKELENVRRMSLQWTDPDDLEWLERRRPELNAQRKLFQTKITDFEQRLAQAQVGNVPPEEIADFCARIQKGIDHFTFERRKTLIELLDIKVIVRRGNGVKRKKKPEGSGVLAISGFIPVPEIGIATEDSEGVFASQLSWSRMSPKISRCWLS
jgi:hypothetical protein